MPNYRVQDIRNIVLAGHGAVGKTSLADNLLYKAGAVEKPGSVDDGTSVSDFDPEEKQRHFSIESSFLHFGHKGRQIHLIDTPGYPDFIGQYLAALRAVETAAVTIAAPAGIEVNTRRTFSEAGRAGVGRMIVINKMDADNIDFAGVLEGIHTTFGNQCILLNVPVGTGADFSAVVSTLNVPASVPEGCLVDPAEIHSQLMDAIVEADEALMVRYLEGELSEDEVRSAISQAVAAGTLIPIVCTSARKGIGLDELLDTIATCALNPAQCKRKAYVGSGEQRKEVTLEPDPAAELVAQVFKVRIDPFVQKLSFLRVFSGTLKKDSSVTNMTTGKSVRIGPLLLMQGGSQTNVEEAIPGDIVAVAKVEELSISDTVVSGRTGPQLARITFPTPMVGLAVQPKSRGDETKISGSLAKIADEDPTFRVTRDTQTKELVVTGMSELHLNVIQSRMRARDKLEVETREPKTAYRETVSGRAEASYRHKKQTGGRGQFAEVHLRVFPIPREGINPEEYCTKQRFAQMRDFRYDEDLNFLFVDSIVGGTIPNQFIPAVEKGVRERMARGVVAGYQVQDIAVEVFFGKDHPVDSSEAAFKTAASIAFREAFQQAKPVLLEPIVNLEITVPGEKFGDITSDLSSRRGQVQGTDALPGGLLVLRAQAPLAEVTTYARALSSMTGGQGSYTMEFSHYDIVPPNEQQKIVAKAKLAEEEE